MEKYHTELSTWAYIRSHKREVLYVMEYLDHDHYSADKGLWIFLFLCIVVTVVQLVVAVLTESLGM